MILNNYLLFIYLFIYLLTLFYVDTKSSKSNILLKIDQNTKSTKLISFHFHLPES